MAAIRLPMVRRFAVIAAEDLNVGRMVRKQPLARAISCSGWGAFRALLEYKADRYGRTVVVVDRWYPSSKTCVRHEAHCCIAR